MILTRSTPLSHPTGRPVVDLSNPITRGLIAASNGRDGTHGLNLSAIPKGLSKGGTVLVAPGASGYRVPLRSSVTSSEWTLFSRGSIPGTNYQAIFGLYGSSSEFISQMPRIFPSNAFGTDARPYAVDSSSGSFLSVGAEFTITTVISASSNVIEHYINGALVSSASLSSTSQITVNSIEVFTKNLTQDRAQAGATIGAFAVFNRALTAKEVGALSANPWQLFRPVQRRIYFDMGAGGGAAHIVTADPVDQGSTATRPGLTQTHVTTARAGAQGTTVTRPPVTQAHVVTARAVTLSGAVNRPAITQTHVVTARAVAHGSTVNAPAVEVGSITVVTARPVAQPSTVNAPSIIQTHIVTARPVAQGGTVTRPGQAQGHQAGSTRPGFEMSSRKVYVKRGKRIHIFDTVEDADEWLEAEDKARQVVNAAKPKPQAKAKVFKALDEAIPHEVVSIDVVRAMVDYLGIPVEMPTLEARQDWAEVARVALMARQMQDEEDIELLLSA